MKSPEMRPWDGAKEVESPEVRLWDGATGMKSPEEQKIYEK